MYIYIYIHVCVYIYIYTCMCMCIYIYIYTHVDYVAMPLCRLGAAADGGVQHGRDGVVEGLKY